MKKIKKNTEVIWCVEVKFEGDGVWYIVDYYPTRFEARNRSRSIRAAFGSITRTVKFKRAGK